MTDKYILNDDGEPVKCEALLVWGRWVQTANRRIAYDTVGDSEVSTIFLALDHNYSGDGDPLLYETMVFGGEHDGYQRRYSNEKAALKGHSDALKMLK